jgi:hypothetical protein
VALRNYQDVTGIDRLNIHKCQNLGRFTDDADRSLASDEFTENAGLQLDGLVSRCRAVGHIADCRRCPCRCRLASTPPPQVAVPDPIGLIRRVRSSSGMGILHHCARSLAGGHRRPCGNAIGQPVWPNSFLLLADLPCQKFLRPAVMTSRSFASPVRVPRAVRG